MEILFGNLSNKIMTLLILLAGLSLTLTSCYNPKHPGKKKMFDQFDFSYNDFFSTCFSIKFTQGDTVYIRQHFASFFDTLKSETSYFAVLSDIERQKVDSFLNKMKFTKYDTSYEESYQDGEYYEFFIKNDTIRKSIYVHSYNIPTELKDFGYWIVEVKKRLKLVRMDTIFEFGSLKYFLPPPVPPPTKIKFTLPDQTSKTKLSKTRR